MQKEKEQQDKLNATPNARTEPKRRHENRRSRSPTPVASVFKRLKRNRPPSPKPRPRKEGGVFNRLGGKERSASTRSDGRHQSSHEKEIEVQPREHHHRGASSRETGGYSESKDSEGGHWKSNQEDTGQTPTKMISFSLGHVRKETLLHLVSGISISQGQGCPATSRHMMEVGIRKII
ncbi:hypothetical protein Tco_0424754 [Tanacetum coccineum]